MTYNRHRFKIDVMMYSNVILFTLHPVFLQVTSLNQSLVIHLYESFRNSSFSHLRHESLIQICSKTLIHSGMKQASRVSD